MPRAGFYNDNEYRAYPFVYRTTDSVDTYAALPGRGNINTIYLTRDSGTKYRWTGVEYELLPPTAPALPDACVVDAGIIMGLMSDYDAAQHSVWLQSVRRWADVFTFTFRTNAPGASAQLLTFDRAATANEWMSEQVIANDWEGFFVTGPLTALAEILANGESLTFSATDYVLEPARIQSLVKSYLRSISLGNYRRTVVTPSAACETESDSANAREVVAAVTGLQGNLRIKEGYNCRITQTNFSREIRVTAESGAGATPDNVLCSNGGELPLYPGETAPAGSQFLSGGPACDETISTINGVGGSNINLIGGAGVAITTDAETATVTVTIDNNNLVGTCGA